MHIINSTKKWLCLCSISAFLGYASLAPKQIQAQSSFSLTVSPPSAYIKIKPGTKANHAIALTNNTANPIVVLPKIFDSQPIADTGYPEMQTSFSFPYLSDPTQSLQPITINPGETREYTISFSVPSEALNKEYPLTVLFSTIIEQEKLSQAAFTQSKLYGVVGANVVVLVSNETMLSNLLKVIDIKRPILLDSLRELSFTPILVNHGIQATIASGSATIVDTFGKTVYTTTIYPDVILGNQRRSARAVGFESANQLPQPVTFTYNPLLLLGKYTITTNLTDAQGNVLNTFTKTCVALPYSVGTAMVLIVLGWVFSQYWLLKKNSSKQ